MIGGDFKRRLFSALVMCIIFVCAFFAGDVSFSIFITIVYTAAIFELFKLEPLKFGIVIPIAGLIFLILMISSFFFLYFKDKTGLLMLIASVVIADVSAFFGGRLFGKHKLCPYISPNKTVEGFIAALFFTTLFLSTTLKFIKGYSCNFSLSFSIALTLAAIFGDLLESWVKRICEIKDSGSIIPGHGGVLDRIDGFLIAAPIFAFFIR